MKKTTLSILVIALVLLVGGLIFYVTQKPSENNEATKPRLTYSNLSNAESLNDVTNDLLSAGLPQEQANIFQSQVTGTNEFLGDFHSFKPEFTTIEQYGVEYDEVDAWNKYNALVVPYPDINCRIAVWTLMKDVISVKPLSQSALDQFEYETQTIDQHPNAGMSQGDKLNFFGFYAPIKSKELKKDNEIEQVIQHEWANRNVTFANSKRSVINVFAYDAEEKGYAAQHAGVLVERDEDFLFVEKWNPSLPFQASIFKSRAELKAYLVDRFEKS
ncbi:MAG: DUF4300 family protein, partial [Bacilli bacterium]